MWKETELAALLPTHDVAVAKLVAVATLGAWRRVMIFFFFESFTLMLPKIPRLHTMKLMQPVRLWSAVNKQS